MNRRKFLKHAAGIPVLPALSPLLAKLGLETPKAASSKSFRRVRPAESDWPSPEKWARLREQVGGRLIPVTSPLAPCKDAPGSAGCAAQRNIKNPWFIADGPGGTRTRGLAGRVDPATSVCAVEAQKTEDVVAAVNFARDNRLRLVVKGGGHSYLGTSNAPDSLLLWTKDLRRITVHDDFVPRGSAGTAPRKAVSLGPASAGSRPTTRSRRTPAVTCRAAAAAPSASSASSAAAASAASRSIRHGRGESASRPRSSLPTAKPSS